MGELVEVIDKLDTEIGRLLDEMSKRGPGDPISDLQQRLGELDRERAMRLDALLNLAREVCIQE